jgi:Tfp pilus assembly protein PilN
MESFHLPMSPEEKAPRIVDLLKRLGIQEDSLSKSIFLVYGDGADDAFSSSLKAIPSIQGVFSPPLDRLDIGKRISGPNRIYASIGLPLRELIKPQFQLNLLPVEMRKKVRQIGKPLFIILALLVFILSLSWGVGAYQRYRDVWNSVNGELKKRKPEIDAVEKVQKQKEALSKEIAEFDKIDTGEASKVEVLRELAQILPATVWIWNFKYNGKDFEISGFADSASDLIPLLDKSPLFERVEFLAPVTKERFQNMIVAGNVVSKEKERFKIKMKPEAKRSAP